MRRDNEKGCWTPSIPVTLVVLSNEWQVTLEVFRLLFKERVQPSWGELLSLF